MGAQVSNLALSYMPCTASTRACSPFRSLYDKPVRGNLLHTMLSGTVAAILLARLYDLTADEALRYVQLFHDTRQQARSYSPLGPLRGHTHVRAAAHLPLDDRLRPLPIDLLGGAAGAGACSGLSS
jgi:hypothetical protein